MKNTFCILLISILLLSCNSKNEYANETSAENDNFSEFTVIVDQYVEEKLKNGNVNSFALAVYKDGETYKNYYGEIDKDANNKPSDSSQYEIASITKTFTGTLVAKAVLDGKLSLNDDIRDYLEGNYSNLEYESQPVTIKNLLTHSIGFDDEDNNGLYAMSNKINRGAFSSSKIDYTIQNFFDDLKTVEITKKPGTVYAYNSVGPELLAFILEKVNKKPFDVQLQMFLNDLGMHNTYMQRHDEKHKSLINSYKGESLAAINVSPFYGAAGGAVSTLPDLLIYAKYLIEHKNETWVKEVSRSLFVDPEDGEQIGYLWQGIDIGEEEGYYYSKTGTSNGIQSGVLICPDSNYGIVLIVNNTSDKALNDWASLLYSHLESDLIKYPRLNLFSILKKEFISNPKSAFKDYRKLKQDTTKYFLSTTSLNNFGYELLHQNQEQKAIDIFKFITEEFPENANAYDSLGEAYFINKDYDKSLLNYKKSLKLDPSSENAKNYIKKIEQLSL